MGFLLRCFITNVVILLLLWAQPFNVKAQFQVTFQVDMSLVGQIEDTISVAGNFQVAAGYPSDWTPGTTLLTDPNIDLIYTGTITLPAGSYEYKFINGNQWGQDEGVPGACAINGNRGMTITANTTLPVVCFGGCSPCVAASDTFDITFQVDMSQVAILEDTISVAGDFQTAAGFPFNWTPGITLLTDPDLDQIYTTTLRVPEGTYNYKFINGNAWGQDENVPVFCSVNNNRELVVTVDSVLIPVCFSSCDTCVPALPAINVTFRVDMNNEIISPNGVFVSGGFQNPPWVKDVLMMTDPGVDGVYEYTYNMVPWVYLYKYYNGNAGDPDAETGDFASMGCGVSNGIGGWDRLLDLTGRMNDTILPVYEFNSCNILVGRDNLLKNEFGFYPNPVKAGAGFRLLTNETQPLNVLIRDLQGKLLQQNNQINPSTDEIYVEFLKPGLYLLEIRNEAGSYGFRKLNVE